jgi:hypothetical protein
MLCLFRDKYSDFTVKHFQEQLVKRHSYYLGYTVTKLTLHAATPCPTCHTLATKVASCAVSCRRKNKKYSLSP